MMGEGVESHSPNAAARIAAALPGACLFSLILLVGLFGLGACVLLGLSWEDGLINQFRFLRSLADSGLDRDASRAGYAGGLAGSLWSAVAATAVAIPIGMGSGIYLEEFAPPGRWQRFLSLILATLADLPPVVFGFLGLGLLHYGPLRGAAWTAGAIAIGSMLLPVVATETRMALRSVGGDVRLSALALGATRWQVLRDHLLPASAVRLLSGILLAVTRGIGELAPLLVLGSWVSSLPSDLYHYVSFRNPDFQRVVAGGAILLLTLTLIPNAFAIFLRGRSGPASKD